MSRQSDVVSDRQRSCSINKYSVVQAARHAFRADPFTGTTSTGQDARQDAENSLSVVHYSELAHGWFATDQASVLSNKSLQLLRAISELHLALVDDQLRALLPLHGTATMWCQHSYCSAIRDPSTSSLRDMCRTKTVGRKSRLAAADVIW